MRALFLLFFIAVLSFTLTGQSSKRVLFLGNSYTAVNNLPQLTASLANSAGDTLIFDVNAPGGYTLQNHVSNSTSIQKILQGNWDFVVLQEQSQKPSWPISQVITDVFPYAKALCDTIRYAGPCHTKPLFFMTWGRKNGDSYNCPNWPPVCTYEGMDSLLNLRYRMMGEMNQALVAPVGAVWHYIRDNYSNIELYDADESHPSAAGSYAAACTFYALIFQKDPNLITNNYTLDQIDAVNIRMATKIIAYDSLAKWNVGKFIPEANFTYSQINDTIFFNNKSKYSASYSWDFGDGKTSSDKNPKHLYSQSGKYLVRLIATKCGKSDTTIQTLNVVINKIDKKHKENIRVYPNPVKNFIYVKTDRKLLINKIELYTLDGRLINNWPSRNTDLLRLSVTGNKAGYYILSFSIDGKRYRNKVVIL